MFATIVEKVEEEERAAKEARYAPPSPLSELYVGITLKSRHTWPKFLGEWAFAEDTIRSCSDETESPPTSPDNEMDHDGTKIKVKVKVNERTSKPVKSILKTRRRGEESQTQPEPTGKGREGGDPGKPPASAASNNKKTTTDSKTATTQTESRTTTTKTNTATSKSNVSPKTAESGQSDQSWIRKKQPLPGQVVSEKSESKTTSEDSQTTTTESKTTKVTANGTKTQTTSSTSTTTTTTKSTTRSLTSHRVEEPKQTQSPAESKSALNTSSAAPKTLPSPTSSPKTTKPAVAAAAAKTEEESKKSTDNGKSKTQALQERLIQKTNKSNGKNNDGSAPKMISTGSLGISKLTEQLNARASPGREVSPRKSPMKEVPKKDKSPSEDSSVKTPPQSSATSPVKNQAKSDASTPPVKENGAQSAKTPVTPTTSSPEMKSPANTSTKSGATSPKPLNGQTTTKALSSTEKSATVTTTTTTTPSSQASSKSASQTPTTAKPQAVTGAKTTPVTPTSTQRPTSLAPLVSTAGSKEQANGKKLEHIKIVKSPTPSPVATAKTPTGSSVKTPVAATAGAPVNGKTALKTSSDNVTTSKPSATNAKTPSTSTVTSPAAKTNGSINQSKSSVSANSPGISQTAASSIRSNQKPLTPSMENQTARDTSDSSRKQNTSVTKKLESPVTQQKIPVHNMALPGKPKPEASGGKSYKVETVLRTTGQSSVPRSGAATASTSNTSTASSSERKQSLGTTVVNKLVIDPKNAERPESPQSFAGQRGKSPVTIHRVRSRETSPATPERRVRTRERGKSPVIQLLPTTPSHSRPATPGVGPPSPVRYLPIISVKERPTEKLIVQQPNPSSIIDLRGLGEPRTGLESGVLQHASNEPVHLIHNEMRTQPIELHRPFGSGKDPEQGMKQTFSTQEIQAHQDESHVHDPKAGIKRSISTEKLFILEKNTDVLSGERLGAVGAKSEVIGTDVTRTHLITERPAVPSQNVQPGQVPVQAMQREILTKENVHKSVMEVAKPDLPKGTVVVEKPGAAVVMRKSFAIDGSRGSSSSSSSEIGSPPGVPSSLAASRNSSRSPSPIRMRPLDYVRDQSLAAQSRVKTSMALNFNQIDPRQSQGQGGTPEVTGQGWYQRPGPVPPRRSSSVDRMMSHQHFSAPTSPMGESPATRRKTSLSFTPFFARTEVKGPVDIKQYLGEGGRAQMDRSRRCQSVERLPTAWYPSQAAVPQYQHQKVYSTRPPTLQRSVSVDVVPSLFGSDSGSYRTFQEIPVQHQVSDSSATLPRRRRRRNSVELMTEMFDAGAPPQAQGARGDPGNRSMEAALQYPEMGQQLLSQIQSLGNENYAFEEGSATLPRGGKDSREPSRLKRRNSVGHMAKIFDQGRPVIAKDEDTDIASPLTAPINVVHPFHQRDEQVGHPQGSLASSRLSASQPHLPGTHSNNSNAKIYGQPRLNRAGNGQANSSRAAACSLNLQNLQKPGHSDPPPESTKPVLRRSLSEKAKSPNGRQPPTIQSQVSMQEDESKQYKRLSVGDAARMFDQKLNPEPPQPKRAGGLNLASKAQKFLSRFK